MPNGDQSFHIPHARSFCDQSFQLSIIKSNVLSISCPTATNPSTSPTLVPSATNPSSYPSSNPTSFPSHAQRRPILPHPPRSFLLRPILPVIHHQIQRPFHLMPNGDQSFHIPHARSFCDQSF